MVDRLTPEQLDAVRAVVVQLVIPASELAEGDTRPTAPRALAFLGAAASPSGTTTRLDEALEGFGRD